MERDDYKVFLVTGAASGIGHACAERLTAHGAHVIAADLQRIGDEVLAGELSGRAEYLHLDVTDEGAWQEAAQAVERRHGRLDGMINAAGIAVENDDVERCSSENWHRVLAVNLDGVFLGCRHGVRLMKAAGGAIVNIASIIGLIGDGSLISYGASKGGVRLLTKSIAVYCCARGYDIRCNSIHPGYIDTPMVRGYLQRLDEPDVEKQSLVERHPLARLGQASEVASVAAYLLSDEAAFVTGAELTVDGGYVAR